jgi:hypothetical protein
MYKKAHSPYTKRKKNSRLNVQKVYLQHITRNKCAKNICLLKHVFAVTVSRRVKKMLDVFTLKFNVARCTSAE